MTMPHRAGFTLIEMLVVIAIIAILAGLLAVAVPAAIAAAKRAATAQRMQNIQTAIQLYGQSTGQNAQMIMRYGMRTPVIKADGVIDPVLTMGDDLQWQPLRSVISSCFGGKSNASMMADRRNLLPNLFYTPTKAVTSYSFKSGDWAWLMDPDAPPAVANKIASLSVLSQCQIGENLDTTQEVLPSGVSGTPKRVWFRARWPRTWPTSNWDQDPPGNIPVRWPAPWGRTSYDPTTLAAQPPLAASLDQLSPLDSIGLLQIAGVLPGGQPGIDAYRNDRSPQKPWNDRWGNPLVVVSAAFLPPRAEACENRTLPQNGRNINSWQGMSPAIRELSATLGMMGLSPNWGEGDPWPYVGGSPRDALLTKYGQDNGFSRAVYIAVAAAGPKLTTPLPGTWTNAEDAQVLRAVWLQVRSVCRAQEWDADAFIDPPWNGVRTGRSGSLRSQLTSPLEIK